MKSLEDYTIVVKVVKGSWWQAYLLELPGVMIHERTWHALHSSLMGALTDYQKAVVDADDAINKTAYAPTTNASAVIKALDRLDQHIMNTAGSIQHDWKRHTYEYTCVSVKATVGDLNFMNINCRRDGWRIKHAHYLAGTETWETLLERIVE